MTARMKDESRRMKKELRFSLHPSAFSPGWSESLSPIPASESLTTTRKRSLRDIPRWRRHYDTLAERLALDGFSAPPRLGRHRVIVPVSNVHRGTVAALRYARALSDDITAVHVTTDGEASEQFRKDWETWGDGVRLVVLESTYRRLLEPLLGYIQDVAARSHVEETITIVVPQFVPERRWHNLLHAQTASFLRMALMFRRGVVVTSVPYQLWGETSAPRGG